MLTILIGMFVGFLLKNRCLEQNGINVEKKFSTMRKKRAEKTGNKVSKQVVLTWSVRLSVGVQSEKWYLCLSPLHAPCSKRQQVSVMGRLLRK